MAAADRHFGVPPALASGVADLAGVFSPGDRRRLLAAIARLERRFPQITFTVLATRVPAETRLGAYAFWIFNRGAVGPGTDRGGANHAVLLTIDPHHGRSNLTIGYGLEPFVGERHLEAALASGLDDFAGGRFAGGALAVIRRIGEILARVASSLDTAYGIRVAELYREESDTPAPASPSRARHL
jgi:uncharacterized membrane protein YgcG